MSDIKAIKLLPRAYQEEIFAQARETNIIAALDTGTGKTLISALLIKWVSSQQEAVGKKIFFLVPKVPLVDQQAEFFRGQTPLRVNGYYGSMGVDEWNLSSWKEQFDKTDLLVMTAQIFYNILQHAYWRLDQVSLIVFDECHHAQKNHPYNRIMTEHYTRCPIHSRPKIFGMTASPIWNPKKPELSLRDLQRNLDARIMAVKIHSEELAENCPRPIEIVERYPCAPTPYTSYQTPSLWQCLRNDGLIAALDSEHEKLVIRYSLVEADVGPLAADYFLHTHMTAKMTDATRKNYEAHLQDLTIEAILDIQEETDDSMQIDQDLPANDHSEVSDSTNPIALVRYHLNAFAAWLSPDFEIPFEWLSPKLQVLVQVLMTHTSSPKFQGILFVDQRHVATALSWLLPRLPQLKDWIRCAELIGHADGNGSANGMHGMNTHLQHTVVQMFRDGKLNLLVATSVGEEGLDFPACDLVIRFDAVQHMVGYLQSRGRARHGTSKFVVMIQDNDNVSFGKYMQFKNMEQELKEVYQGLHTSQPTIEEEDDSRDDARDIDAREIYVVESTGAVLTFSSAGTLLGHLCDLIPHDRYTPAHRPKFSGDFQSILELPSALPLPRDQLIYYGPPKRTKKEAKRAVAYMAVKNLFLLGVFDDHLTPAKPTKGMVIEDADGKSIPQVKECPNMMDVMVRDPWTYGPPWWLHVVYLDGKRSAGLVTGAQLPVVDLMSDAGVVITLGPPNSVNTPADPLAANELMQEFMKIGSWWCITGTPIESDFGCYIVPLDPTTDQPDWESLERTVSNKRGSYNWEGITGDVYAGRLLVMSSRKYGQPLLLHAIREDLNPDAKLPDDLAEELEGCKTYADYFVHLYSSEHMPPLEPLLHGPLLEVVPAPRLNSSIYYPQHLSPPETMKQTSANPTIFVPQRFCKWLYLNDDVFKTFYILPKLCRRIVDIYRVRCFINELRLPAIQEDRMVEAFTLPCANAGFSNQRLETLGDSVLKLCVIVYLYNRFPHKHEGQLDILKRNCVSNRLLLARAREIGLETYLTSEARLSKSFDFMIDREQMFAQCGSPLTRRRFARRSLQDCMEASLGASYLTGGIDMALQTGTTLGLCFGGDVPWPIRYGLPEEAPAAPLFSQLQEALGYSFRNGRLLAEAVTHPSFDSPGGSCYQRLEFLGDAVIELVLSDFLFAKFPSATSGQMSWSRAKAVCGPTLGAVAVKRLSLQKYILANNIELSKAIQGQITLLTTATHDDLVRNFWRYDPPKALSDVLESLVGAVFVDSGYSFSVASSVVRELLKEVMGVLTPNLPRDPVSELMIWTMKAGCRRIRFSKSASHAVIKRNDSMAVLVHEITIAGPISAMNLSLAKGIAADKALNTLRNPMSDLCLQRVCDCGKEAEDPDISSDARALREKDLNDETEAGFALTSAKRLEEEAVHDAALSASRPDDLDAVEEQEVENLMLGAMDVDSEEGATCLQ